MRIVILLAVLVGAGCQSLEDKQDYRDAQVEIVQVQADANARKKQAAALERAELYKQMALVSASNPEVADAIAVGLALAAAQLNADQGRGDSITQLKTESNQAVEIARALGPATLTMLGQVGVAAIAAETQRQSSDNMARVQINRDNVTGAVVTAVTDMSAAAIEGAGTDYYLQDNAWVDNSTDSSVNTTSTTTNTTTVDENNWSIADSYNTTSTTTTNTTEVNEDNDTTTTTETNTTTTTTESNTTTTTTSTDDNSAVNNNVVTWVTSGGEVLTTDQVLDLLAEGLTLSLVIDGQVTEVDAAAACEADPELCP